MNDSAASVPAEGRGFLVAWLAVIIAAGTLAALAPLRLSILAVFLFAGPHNWMEARYFLARLPARGGKLRGYFALALSGTIGLGTALVALLACREQGWLGEEAWLFLYCVTQTLFVVWLASLATLRAATNPRREWGWVWPAALLAIAAAWLAPAAWSVALVYLHPLMALWLLDREVKRSRPRWRAALHVGLFVVPVAVGLLFWRFADAPPVPDENALGRQIADHAGTFALPGVPEPFLVACHAFLELLHYAVWIALMPWLAIKTAPWQLTGTPLTWRGPIWRKAAAITLALGALLVLALWVGFVVDYATTRTVYFAVATLHVLAEFPFLLRAL